MRRSTCSTRVPTGRSSGAMAAKGCCAAGANRNALARFGDVAFVVAQIKEMNARARYRARFDTTAMGISGHSFGAITTLVAAGQQNAAVGQRFAVPELKGSFARSR